jgi:hypothetical protein
MRFGEAEVVDLTDEGKEKEEGEEEEEGEVMIVEKDPPVPLILAIDVVKRPPPLASAIIPCRFRARFGDSSYTYSVKWQLHWKGRTPPSKNNQEVKVALSIKLGGYPASPHIGVQTLTIASHMEVLTAIMTLAELVKSLSSSSTAIDLTRNFPNPDRIIYTATGVTVQFTTLCRDYFIPAQKLSMVIVVNETNAAMKCPLLPPIPSAPKMISCINYRNTSGDVFSALHWEKAEEEGATYQGWRVYDNDPTRSMVFTTAETRVLREACDNENCTCKVGIRQINDNGSSPVTYYNEGGEASTSLCAICLCPLDICEGDQCVVMPNGCIHLFHEGCLTQWSQKQQSCPLCKISYENVSLYGQRKQMENSMLYY